MLSSSQRRDGLAARGRTAGLACAAPALATLAGCSPGVGAAPAWGFVSLALLIVAAAAFAVGTLRERAAQQRALRQARAAARDLAELQVDWRWQTDRRHALVAWQGPRAAAVPHCLLFDDAQLQRQLHAQRAFAGFRIHAAAALQGSRGWELRAVPSFDDLGVFDGFIGHARPLDDEDACLAAAGALVPALASHAAPALVLHDAGAGWEVQHFNPAAQLLWPQIEPAAALPTLVAQLPAAVATALHGGAITPQETQGWQLLPFGPLPGGGRGLLLAQAAGAPAGGDAMSAGEGESFSFTVSHDLRAPIRVVEGFTRIVKEDYGRLLDRVGNDHLDRVLGAAARMNLMIDALLTLARLSSQPLARQPVNLSQLANFVVDDLRRATPERDAEVDVQPGLTTQGDPTLLRLVLENLLGNAWKYSARSARAQISLHASNQDGRTTYVVRDNGAGFDMRSADRLFGLFQRLHSASEFPGHGVGLASVRRIVRRHGGDIWAEAEPGRGAAFSFTLG